MKPYELADIVAPLRRLLVLLAILSVPAGSASGDLFEYNGAATTTRFRPGPDGVPVSATTLFYGAGIRMAAEHELLHAIGFTVDYPLFAQHVDEGRNFKDAQGNVLGILTPKNQGTHLDPDKKVGGEKQSTSVMTPHPGGNEAGELEKKILNAAFNWTGLAGLEINIRYTGRAIEDGDREWIERVVDRIQRLFGPAGANPKQFAWDVQNVDPPAPAPKEQPAQINSGGRSIAYDAQSETLSIRDDVMEIPDDPTDPINGADVLVPDFHFNGDIGHGKYYFFNESFGDLVIDKGGEVFLRAEVAALLYDAPANYFYWTLTNVKLGGAPTSSSFYDPTLTSTVSPFIGQLLASLDQDSPQYRPDELLYFSYQPEVDLGQTTLGFTQDGSSAASNIFFTSEPVPTPSSVVLLAAGLMTVPFGRRLVLRAG